MKKTKMVFIKSIFSALVLSNFLIQFTYANTSLNQGRFLNENETNAEVTYINDSLVEQFVKESIIDNAKKTIRVVNFEHPSDYYGMRITTALRLAAKRGVIVEYVYDQLMTFMGGDQSNRSLNYLLDNKLSQNIKVTNMFLVNRLSKGIYPAVAFHSKMIIVDQDTPEEIIFFGGRNYGNKYINWIDAGFTIRRLDVNKPYVGDMLHKYFDRVWSFLVYNNFKVDKSFQPDLSEQNEILKNEKAYFRTKLVDPIRNKVIQDFKLLFSRSALDQKHEIKQIPTFYPQESTLSSSDVLADRFLGRFSDKKALNNPNIRLIANILANTKNIDFTSYVFSPPELIMNSLKKCSQDERCHLDVYTNNKYGYKLNRIPLPSFAEQQNYNFFSSLNLKNSNPNLKLFELNVSPNAKSGEYNFLHRKLIIADDYVISGSDNYSYASSVFNEEIVFVFKDPIMANYLRKLNRIERQKYFAEVSSNKILPSNGIVNKSLKNFLYDYIL